MVMNEERIQEKIAAAKVELETKQRQVVIDKQRAQAFNANAVRKVIHPNKRKVADAYLAGANKQDSLKVGGFCKGSLYIFKEPLVMAYMETKLNRITRKYSATTENIIEEYSKMGFANLGDYTVEQENGDLLFDLSDMPMYMMAALSEYTTETYTEGRGDAAKEVKKVRVKLHDKRQALDSLARIKGMFNDKLQLSGGLTLNERLNKGRQRVSAAKQEREKE